MSVPCCAEFLSTYAVGKRNKLFGGFKCVKSLTVTEPS